MSKDCKTCSNAELLYYRFMVPEWLRKESKAKWRATTGGDELNLTIEPDATKYENIFKLGLIGPDILEKREDITVKIKVGVILPEPQKPRDPMSFMVTDGEHGIGIQLLDPNHDYATSGPYRAIEGDVEGYILDDPNTELNTNFNTNSRNNPDQFEINLLPSAHFGSAYCAIDDGHKIVAQYSRALNLKQGLNLEMYRFEKGERYTVNYLEVSVYKNSPALAPNEC